MKSKSEENLISFESRQKKEWTVIVLSHFSKELIGFLSVDATGEMFIHFEGNVAKIRSIIDSIEYNKSIDLSGN
ncbi:hypothetical protein LLW22_04015 [Enterococcus casseliflavus]|jgi:hypothetical protein|uniref:hypothetical protein n=1 Tax=Enterococcus sp. AZ136 TaxID=2774788 RepID=UPI001FD5BD22|nr:hypothetical protein LLW22_04015 [Enterococcus casseliflavus]